MILLKLLKNQTDDVKLRDGFIFPRVSSQSLVRINHPPTPLTLFGLTNSVGTSETDWPLSDLWN